MNLKTKYQYEEFIYKFKEYMKEYLSTLDNEKLWEDYSTDKEMAEEQLNYFIGYLTKKLA